MSDTTLTSAEQPALVEHVGRAIMRVVGFGMELLAHIRSALSVNDTTHLPKRVAADPDAAQRRIDTAMCWLIALSRTLVGNRLYLPTLGPIPLPKASLAQAKPEAKTSPAKPRPYVALSPDAAQFKSMRRTFARRPIGAIMRRICRQFGINPKSDDWPTQLIAITETPLDWSARRYATPPPPIRRPLVNFPIEPGPRPHQTAPPPPGTVTSVIAPSRDFSFLEPCAPAQASVN